MTAEFPPKAYIIGAQKAGTTTLAYLLDQHPAVSLSRPKEPHFFSTSWDHGFDWYRTRFPERPGSVLLDASTSYTMANLDPRTDFGITAPVARRIHEARPDARLIYVLRDPVDRIVSHYWHTVRFGKERRPFREAIEANPGYIWPSMYHKQIALYFDLFDREQIKFIDFRDLSRDPVAVCKECCRFLGVDPDGAPIHLDAPKNQSFTYTVTGRVTGLLISQDRLGRTASVLKTVLPVAIYGAIRRLFITDVPEVDEADRAWAWAQLQCDARAVLEMTGFPPWR